MKSNNSSVLIIDDEQMIVDQLSFFLSEFEYEVTGLSDSKKALEYINKNAYDIVLTDLKMPDVSGLDIIKAVNYASNVYIIGVMPMFISLFIILFLINMYLAIIGVVLSFIIFYGYLKL